MAEEKVDCQNSQSYQTLQKRFEAPDSLSELPENGTIWYTELFKNLIPFKDWLNVLFGSEQRQKALVTALNAVCEDSRSELLRIRPDPGDLFAFARYTKVEDIRVVIIGQDPYPNDHAHGICFSSLQNSMPKSALNIFKCLCKSKIIDSIDDISSYDLRPWCTQGVLMLNTALTTLDKNPKKHTEIWKDYMTLVVSKIVKQINEYKSIEPVFWMLWGKDAYEWENVISKYNPHAKHHILKWGHPSPLSALNQTDNPKNFVNCTHFIEVNDYLKSFKRDIIWDTRALTKSLHLFLHIDKGNKKVMLYCSQGFMIGKRLQESYSDENVSKKQILSVIKKFLAGIPQDGYDSCKVYCDISVDVPKTSTVVFKQIADNAEIIKQSMKSEQRAKYIIDGFKNVKV
jgi:uracil-DNA glycosylase